MKQTGELTEMATLKFRSKRNQPIKPWKARPKTTRKVSFKMVPSFSLKPDLRRAMKEVSKAVNLDWISNQTCRPSKSESFYKNNYNLFVHPYEGIRFTFTAAPSNSSIIIIIGYIEDLTLVVISYEIFETSLRRVS